MRTILTLLGGVTAIGVMALWANAAAASRGAKPIDGFHAVVPTSTLDRLRQTTAAGNGDVPCASLDSFRRGHKLILMVRGMAHCGGGAAPNAFGQLWAPDSTGPANDIVTALEHGVEKDEPPQSIVATKFDHDDPKCPVQRTMPRCPFPAMARYAGRGDVNDASSWSCSAGDRRLLKVGRAGREAGSDAELAP